MRESRRSYLGTRKVKVWKLTLLSSYLISLIVCLFSMALTQNRQGIAMIWFFGNIFLFGLIILIKGLIWIIKNRNKEIYY